MSGILTVGKLVLTNTTSNQDAFDRLRVSNPTTLMSFYIPTNKGRFQCDRLLIGTGTATDTITTEMTVPVNGDRVIIQTKEYVVYNPGQCRLIYITGVLDVNYDGSQSGIISRMGSFDDHNDKTADSKGDGNFLELNCTGITPILYAVERTSTLGSNQTDIKVAQADWNIDPMDGTGPSGLTFTDYSKNILLVIDISWLGVGQVRMGFLIDNVIRYFHIFRHSGYSVPYIRTASLPIRFEISKNAATAHTGLMRACCTSIQSEGICTPIGVPCTSNTGLLVRNVTNTFALPWLSIRLKAANCRATVRIQEIVAFLTAATQYITYSIVLNPTLAGPTSFVSVHANSIVEMDTASTSFAGGTVLTSDFNAGRSAISSVFSVNENIKITSNIAGISDIITISVQRIGGAGNIPVNLLVRWLEDTV